MARTHLTPSLRRLAIFLVAIALVAAISPGLALAANGPPQPVDDPINTVEDAATSGNVLANDGNLGDGPLSVTGFAALAPSIGTLTIDADGDYSFTPAADWNGSASTTYTVYNGKHSRTGNILITVTAGATMRQSPTTTRPRSTRTRRPTSRPSCWPTTPISMATRWSVTRRLERHRRQRRLRRRHRHLHARGR